MKISTAQLSSRKSNRQLAFLKQSIIFLCVFIALQCTSPALVFAATANAIPADLGQKEALDRAGVSVVRLLVSYTAQGAAEPDVQCTGLGVLGDFGIAAVAHSESSMVEQKLAGTAPYIAPEQIRGRPQPASDQYSLGVVTYEWLSGDRPFQGSEVTMVVQHLTEAPPPLRQKMPSLSPMVEEVVMKALKKDPAQRFASVKAFATALEQAAKQPL